MTKNESSGDSSSNSSLKYEPEEYETNVNIYDDPRYRYSNPRHLYNRKSFAQRKFVPKKYLSDYLFTCCIVIMLIGIVSIFISILCLGPSSSSSKMPQELMTLNYLERVCNLEEMLKEREDFIVCERSCLESRHYCDSMLLIRRQLHTEEEGSNAAVKELCDNYIDTCSVLNLIFDNNKAEKKGSQLRPPPTRLSSICSQSSLTTIEGFEDCSVACSVASCCEAGTDDGGCYEANADVCDVYRDDCGKMWTGIMTKTTTKSTSKVTTEEDKSDQIESIMTEEEKTIQQACSQTSTATPEGLEQCRDVCTGHMCCVMDENICKCADKNKDCTLYKSCHAILEHHTWLPMLDDDCEKDGEDDNMAVMRVPAIAKAQESSNP